MRVGFAGPPGAYGELAAKRLCPGARGLGLGAFDDVLEALLSGRVDRAVLPIGNSTAGAVTGQLERLAAAPVSVVGAMWLQVRHQLLALPGADPGALRVVWSHPQALAQCRHFLEARGLEGRADATTSAAAARVAASRDRSLAALASVEAGRAHGLVVVEADVQDEPDNRTRFALLALESTVDDAATGEGPLVDAWLLPSDAAPPERPGDLCRFVDGGRVWVETAAPLAGAGGRRLGRYPAWEAQSARTST